MLARQRCPHCGSASTRPLNDSEKTFGLDVVHQLAGAVENHDPVAAAADQDRNLALASSTLRDCSLAFTSLASAGYLVNKVASGRARPDVA